MIKLVKSLPSQGQTLALLRMLMALLQTNSFKANNQILTKADTVQNFGLFGSANEKASHISSDPPTSCTNPLQYSDFHTLALSQLTSKKTKFK